RNTIQSISAYFATHPSEPVIRRAGLWDSEDRRVVRGGDTDHRFTLAALAVPPRAKQVAPRTRPVRGRGRELLRHRGRVATGAGPAQIAARTTGAVEDRVAVGLRPAANSGCPNRTGYRNKHRPEFRSGRCTVGGVVNLLEVAWTSAEGIDDLLADALYQ